MRKIGILASAAIGLAAMTAVASAADLAPAPAPYYDWSGAYVGLNAGAAWGDFSYNGDATGPLIGSIVEDDVDFDDAVFTGGGMIGYNWQYDTFVLGVEADFNYLGFDQSAERNGTILGQPASVRGELSADWYGTLRGRLGYAADNFLIYGTGGLAYGNVEVEGRIRVGNDQWTASESNVNWGWTAGAGVEYGVDENWTLGVEYLYVDLGSNDDWDFDSGVGNAIASEVGGNTDAAFSVVRATAKFRF